MSAKTVFPPTNWSDLRRLRCVGIDEDRRILSSLATRYWPPIHDFLRARGAGEQEAKDLAQAFFAFALETRLFYKADPSRGRFRDLLLKSLSHFVAKTRRTAATQKRKPPGGWATLDRVANVAYFQPPSLRENDSPETVFHRRWVQEVVANVLKALERECAITGKRRHFELFRDRVVAPELEGVVLPSLESLAQAHGLTCKDAANRITTAKRAFRRLLTEEVRRYASSEADSRAEQADAFKVLGFTAEG